MLPTSRVICPPDRGFLPFEQGTGLPVGKLIRTIPLQAVATPGGVAHWRNDFPFPVSVKQARLVLLAASGSAGTVTVGKAANIGSLPSTAFSSLLSVNVATVYNTLSGTGARPSGELVAPGEAVTVSQDGGTVAGINGYLELELLPLGQVRGS